MLEKGNAGALLRWHQLVGFLLFVFMVLLVSTGDAGDIVKGRKIGDVIMPDREIETLFDDDVEPPEEPEVAPPDIAPLN